MKDWDAYFMDLAGSVARANGSCLRRKFGAVLVRPDRSIVSTGYNGAPRGVKSCGERGFCHRDREGIASGERHEACYAVHAEQNALVFAGKHGSPTDGTTLYCTAKPCGVCLRLIVQAGVREVVYRDDYPVPFPGYEEIAAAILLRRLERPATGAENAGGACDSAAPAKTPETS